MPVLFVGHGSPLNAIEQNRWSAAFRALAGLLPRPRAVLAVSAHWYVGGTVPEWAAAFDAEVARALERRDAATLTGVLETDQGRLAHPTPDHYLPLLYSFGASDTADRVRFPVTGFDMGSLSMRSVLFG